MRLVGISLIAAIALSACTSASEPQATSAPSETPAPAPAFPVTLVHSQGETTIEELPERIASLGSQHTDALLALGAVPVVTTYPLTRPIYEETLAELGAAVPEVLTENDDVDGTLAALAEFAPDVILAPQQISPLNGNVLLSDGYLRLTEVAPTVYPTASALDSEGYESATSWREALIQVGAVLGKSADAAAQLESFDATVAALAEEHPEFSGKTIAVTRSGSGGPVLVTATSPVALILEALGFTVFDPTTIESDVSGDVVFFEPDQAALLDVDVLIVSDDEGGQTDTIRGYGDSPTYADGTVLHFGQMDQATQLALVVPTALTAPASIEAFVSQLAAALK
ncbi:ABC transporter substrate-binding protein [Salinibacterium sp. NK8237]|uniref:ABC transporter substrate-binding protein n=1 Tax=Salinibacterium sp. NK8237 TaxID=2792038 RepID=UPI001E4B2FA7|nr:ABC transporter substrate-binding protein [Salinibacterium sp. NK8237]